MVLNNAKGKVQIEKCKFREKGRNRDRVGEMAAVFVSSVILTFTFCNFHFALCYMTQETRLVNGCGLILKFLKFCVVALIGL
jgi:hypothetical protein